jgi:hypothetical protein
MFPILHCPHSKIFFAGRVEAQVSEMDPATVLMLLVSCRHDLLLCREETEADVRYESVAECENHVPAEIARLSAGGHRAFAKCHVYGTKPYDVGKDSFWHVSADGNLKALFSISEINANTLPPEQKPKPKPRNTHAKGTVHVTRYNDGAKETSSYDFRNRNAAEKKTSE